VTMTRDDVRELEHAMAAFTAVSGLLMAEVEQHDSPKAPFSDPNTREAAYFLMRDALHTLRGLRFLEHTGSLYNPLVDDPRV